MKRKATYFSSSSWLLYWASNSTYALPVLARRDRPLELAANVLGVMGHPRDPFRSKQPFPHFCRGFRNFVLAPRASGWGRGARYISAIAKTFTQKQQQTTCAVFAVVVVVATRDKGGRSPRLPTAMSTLKCSASKLLQERAIHYPGLPGHPGRS